MGYFSLIHSGRNNRPDPLSNGRSLPRPLHCPSTLTMQTSIGRSRAGTMLAASRRHHRPLGRPMTLSATMPRARRARCARANGRGSRRPCLKPMSTTAFRVRSAIAASAGLGDADEAAQALRARPPQRHRPRSRASRFRTPRRASRKSSRSRPRTPLRILWLRRLPWALSANGSLPCISFSLYITHIDAARCSRQPVRSRKDRAVYR